MRYSRCLNIHDNKDVSEIKTQLGTVVSNQPDTKWMVDADVKWDDARRTFPLNTHVSY